MHLAKEKRKFFFKERGEWNEFSFSQLGYFGEEKKKTRNGRKRLEKRNSPGERREMSARGQDRREKFRQRRKGTLTDTEVDLSLVRVGLERLGDTFEGGRGR